MRPIVDGIDMNGGIQVFNRDITLTYCERRWIRELRRLERQADRFLKVEHWDSGEPELLIRVVAEMAATYESLGIDRCQDHRVLYLDHS